MGLKDDLIYCLEMNDSSGDATDEHTNGYDFGENGTVGSVSGVIGNARDPQPPGEYFNRASNSNLQVGDVNFCGSVWINPDVSGVMAIVGQYSSTGNNRSWRLMTSGSNLTLTVSSDGTGTLTTLTASGVIGVASWYHIFFYHDAENNELGIVVNDGTPTTTSYASGVYAGTADIEIGRSNGGSDFNGQIDQTAFWKGRILSSQEITDLYNSGSGLAYSGWAGDPAAAISGTAIAAIDEDDVVTGGTTIVITLTSDTWVAAGSAFDAQRQAIIDGLNSSQSEGTGWNAEVRDNLAVTTVARTSDTVVTITLSAQAGYAITTQETITVTVPASALVTSGDAVVGSPTYTVDPVVSADLTHWMGVGGVSDSSFKYRGRTNGDLSLQIRYSTNSDLSGSTTSTGVTTDSVDDNTGGEEITGLAAATTYYYTPVVDGVDAFSQPFPSFRTHPAEDVDAALVIAFGSCMDDPDESTIFGSIAAESPDLFLHLGDFGYTDSTVLATQRDNYKTMHDSGEEYHQNIVRSMAVERVWDDHDYGGDNEDGDLSDKANALQAWKEFTAYHDLANASNGIWRDFKIANVHFFVLDGRYRREGTKVRFPTTGRFTADSGSGGTSLVIPSGSSPSGSDDFYNGYYVKIGPTDKLYRVTDYVGSTRTCTLDRSADDLVASSSSCFMAEKSTLDMDFIANGQVDWLVDGINGSPCRWIVIVSGTSMNLAGNTGGDIWGSWDGDDMELGYLRDNITHPNVVVISGDLHISGIDDGTNGYWPEASISPLNQTDQGSLGTTWSEGTDSSGHKYGLLTIATSPHTLTLTCRDADGTTTASITPLVVSDNSGSSVSPNDATHAHTADSPTITQTHAITPHAATHAHAAESPAISQVHAIAPAECLHAHAAESPAISQVHAIAPAECLHAHAAESPAVAQSGTIVPNDSTHAHTAESPAISQVHAIAPAECLHAHATESPAISQVHIITPTDGLHAHTATSPTVTSGATVSPAECLHAHSADSPVLTQLHYIGPEGCLHAHSADSPVITIPTTAAADDPWIAPTLSRAWLAQSTNRVWTATGGR